MGKPTVIIVRENHPAKHVIAEACIDNGIDVVWDSWITSCAYSMISILRPDAVIIDFDHPLYIYTHIGMKAGNLTEVITLNLRNDDALAKMIAMIHWVAE